jgi:hypothetical protein
MAHKPERAPNSPSPGRARLAATIERCAAASAYIEKARGAKAKANGAWHAANRVVEDAEARLTEARASNDQHRLARLMGEEPAGPSVDDLQREVDAARAVLTTAGEDEALVDGEIARAHEALERVRYDRKAAIADVVARLVADLVEQHRAACAKIGEIQVVLDALAPGSAPNFVDAIMQTVQRPTRVAAVRGSLAALETNADAPLPDLGPTPSDVAA